MTQTRRLIGIMLLACFALSAVIAVGVFGFGTYKAGAAELTNVDNYYGVQLITDEQKAFYQAMQEMATVDVSGSSMFIRGEDLDLVNRGYFDQTQLEAYANGDTTLLDAMGAARDAFYTDYDDIFYVDFEYLSLRVTQDAGNQYHAYLGVGRSDTYWTQGFASEAQIKSAISAYSAELDNIVSLAKAAQPTDEQKEDYGEELAIQIEQIRKAHAEIAKKTVYRLESTASAGNEKHVRTPYGALVVGEALCEGYSRAFKAVMDKLDVPCVLINGGYRHTETQIEEHMWNYVQLVDGNWYAVDMTFDDINLDDKGGVCPIDELDTSANARVASEQGYYYSEEFFLKGALVMDVHHARSPYKSAVEYAFTYPTLSTYNVGSEETVTEYIKVVQMPSVEATNSTDIYISVLIDGEWCGHEAAAAKGYYFLIRYEGNYLPEKIANGKPTGEKLTGGDLVTDDEEGTFAAEYSTGYVWAYIYNPTFPEPLYGNLYSEGEYSVIRNESKALGFEIAVTNTPPRDYNNTGDIDKIAQMTTFTGDASVFFARTGFLPVKYGDPNYQPAPHIVRSTPVATNYLLVGKTYEVKVEYDQLLQVEEGQEFQYSVYGMRPGGEILKGTNAVPISVITNVSWYEGKLEDGVFTNSYVTFTFTPSRYFAHDSIYYVFDFNLFGVNSEKQVNNVVFLAANATGYCSLGVPGYNWRVYGQPKLIDEGDLSTEGWIDSNGNEVGTNMDRIALVVTSPNQRQNKEMNELLKDELDMDYQEDGALQEGMFESFTYNIQLTICKAMIIKTGEAVHVSIGFPEGFNYQSWMNGVEFKMYHFIHDEQDNIIGVEEIPITVTEYGLIILVKSFSPFALVAVKTDAQEQSTDKDVFVYASNGGSAHSDVEVDDKNSSNLFHLKEGQIANVTIKANVGYTIQSINIEYKKIVSSEEGKKLETTSRVFVINTDQLVLPVDYNDIDGIRANIQVNFVPEKVLASDVQRGESLVVENADNSTRKEVKSAIVSVSTQSISVDEGNEIRIEATVTSDYDNDTYQWYRDGVALTGQTGKSLVIDEAQTSDTGNYVLKVTSSVDGFKFVAESNGVDVTVNAKPTAPGAGLTQTQKIIVIVASSIGGLAVLAVAVLGIVKSRKNAD